MKVVLQRVSKAQVSVENKIIGKIKRGVVILLGITENDTQENIDYLVNKILNLRIFNEEERYFEKSLLEIQGEILIISQFTLYASCKKGRRPDFIKAAKPETAKKLYLNFVEKAKQSGLKTETGEFGADMQVELTNDGPVTLTLEK